ncbi:hypothetical protein [Roseinatronobacter bogoriensis]|uniref:hypothetical protein n=1 Tax=Roseinatronobacter bogoriensis TaxID=119542 RepID=UPI0010658D84|nr:hypothetical protein [Rhodobaca bogoriensis]MBB4207236.1 hypothetical protein [Rhodobaca bogoriensis DSM 18756]TDY65737.1 hypothetical protein EV660_1175 [Rhodobaca bogoriensis DSM 18756]
MTITQEQIAAQIAAMIARYDAKLDAAEDEVARLRDLIKRIKNDADEWCISRMTGNPELENQKGERMWKSIRDASSSTAPIEPSAALQEKSRD